MSLLFRLFWPSREETDPNTYKNLFIIGEFNPGQLYGLPKINKNSTNPPLRPIISMTGTVTHALAQYLNKIIQPYINSNYIIRSSDELLVHLSQLHLQPQPSTFIVRRRISVHQRTGRRYYQHHLARSSQSPYSAPARYSTKSPTGTAQNLHHPNPL